MKQQYFNMKDEYFGVVVACFLVIGGLVIAAFNVLLAVL